jgi:ergothioneine biosynthesis protein EgtB
MHKAVAATHDRNATLERYREVRSHSETLCRPLETDDYQLQSIVQTSPPKWHLAHISWFFEAFVLPRFYNQYKPLNEKYDFLFNSYYYRHGEMHPRPKRGMLSRPTVEEIYHYRAHIDHVMLTLMQEVDDSRWNELEFLITLGLNHEQQHQELLLMDIKHNFWGNPLKPAYREELPEPSGESHTVNWIEREGGRWTIGHQGHGFAYDNETPRHEVLIRDHRLADRFVTNGEFLEFIHDGGYQNPALWLSDGWTLIHQQGWRHPLYWQMDGESPWQFTLGGQRKLNLDEPVCHLSFFEADAYARWIGKRLPLEEELETMLEQQPVEGNFTDSGLLHPAPSNGKAHWFGDLWAWTASPYRPYPGFQPLEGSLGEYNGKFMASQMVLKGGCCATPAGHIRSSYRNFFYPDERWAFTGLRLAEDG